MLIIVNLLTFCTVIKFTSIVILLQKVSKMTIINVGGKKKQRRQYSFFNNFERWVVIIMPTDSFFGQYFSPD
ncbi:MAG: hypothetical protein AUK59_01575 [Candidatus Altarchaeum sp. CG2_30_32_3053]|nr:MAG: hypothetical protein AUK59_01575 [Candidatus Altarchaeum sp. CG2_30_32_3053]